MRAGIPDEKATLPEPSALFTPTGASPRLALTIAFHPDLARVGERTILGPVTLGTEAAIGRNGPSFAHPAAHDPDRPDAATAPGAPLDDPHVSRTPIVLSVVKAGAVHLDATKTSTSVVVRGRTIASATFTADEVKRGVVLLLAGRVVVLLHTVTLAPWPLRGDDLGLFGESDGLRGVLAEVKSVSDLTRPVLLRGESGSGKELVARAVHQVGPRRAAPFVAVNLGAIPATIAAAELFGSERGAFTGAVRRRGHFEQAEGGTLFLDEIGEAPVELQAALLRALQDGEIQPVGAERPRKIDVRIVAATDADLEARMADGSFRAPLHNRLAAYQIWIPPLRERRDDIARLLVRFFREELRAIGEEAKLTSTPAGTPWLPAALVAKLADYHWPGNVRQLANVVRHLVIGSRALERVTLTDAAARLLTDWSTAGDPDLAAPPSSSDPASRDPASSSRPAAANEATSAANASATNAANAANAATAAAAADAGRAADPRARPRRAGDIAEAEIAAALEASGFEIAAAAKRLGIPRPSLHLAMKRLGLRTAGDLAVAEIQRAFTEAAGDLPRMARTLRVSERALLRRVRELGLP